MPQAKKIRQLFLLIYFWRNSRPLKCFIWRKQFNKRNSECVFKRLHISNYYRRFVELLKSSASLESISGNIFENTENILHHIFLYYLTWKKRKSRNNGWRRGKIPSIFQWINIEICGCCFCEIEKSNKIYLEVLRIKPTHLCTCFHVLLWLSRCREGKEVRLRGRMWMQLKLYNGHERVFR